MSIGQLAGTLLQDPLQSLLQPGVANLGGFGGGGLGGLGLGGVDPGISALLGGQLNPAGGGMFGGTDPSMQLMMTLASLLLGNNNPLDQFPQLNGNAPTAQQAQTAQAAPAQVATAPAQQERQEPELPVVADKTSINGGNVTLGKDLLMRVAKNPQNAVQLVEQELQNISGGQAAPGKDKTMQVLNMFRAGNPSTHPHGAKSDGLYKNLLETVARAAVEQSRPFREIIEAEEAQAAQAAAATEQQPVQEAQATA